MEMTISLSSSFKSTIISYTAFLICLTDFENEEKEVIFRMTKINIGNSVWIPQPVTNKKK